jgi:HEPN domain-containing protein
LNVQNKTSALHDAKSNVLDEPSYSAVGFHARQCIEKYLKAFLQEHDIEIIKTHDLVFLLDRTRTLKPLWLVYRQMLELLNDYSVDVRYPGEDITKEEAMKLSDS